MNAHAYHLRPVRVPPVVRVPQVGNPCSKSWKWEGECGALKMHMCVGWVVKWNSLWRYTTLPSYNFMEWMISMVATVHLWRLCNIVNQSGSNYILWKLLSWIMLTFSWCDQFLKELKILFGHVIASSLITVNIRLMLSLYLGPKWSH